MNQTASAWVGLVLTLFGIQLTAQVPSWRNGGSGHFPNAHSPVAWGEKGKEAWSTPLESSNGSPILVDGRLFVNEEPDVLVCIDSESGNVLWRRKNGLLDLLGLSEEELTAARATIEQSNQLDLEIKKNLYEIRRMERSSNALPEDEFRERYGRLWEIYFELGEKKEALSREAPYGETVMPAMHPTNGYTTYTPVSDGERVFACFGFGAVVAYDLEGNRLWHRVLDDTDHVHGGTVSPILVDSRLIVRFSDYVALDPESGDEQWRTSSGVTFGTSVPFVVQGQHFIFTPRGEVIRIEDGEKIVDGLIKFKDADTTHTTFSSPVFADGHLFTVRGESGREGIAYCFRIPETVAALETLGLESVWEREVLAKRYYGSPLVDDGLLYLLTEDRWTLVLDCASGDEVYRHQINGINGTTYPSLTMAGGLLFVCTQAGHVIAVKPGREFKELHRSTMSRFLSSPIFFDGSVYLRTLDGLYAFR